MLSRCGDPRAKDYRYYGGRGITVCDRWKEFHHFVEDMGDASLGLTLGRIDNLDGYFKDNCRWETWSQQNRNRRKNV